MHILIIALSDLKNDPRVFRQISWFSRDHTVTCMGYREPGIEKVRFIQIEQPKRTIFEKISNLALIFCHRYDAFLQKKFRTLYCLEPALLLEQFDVIIANDIETLPFAISIKKSAKILFDAHEYYPKEYEDHWLWKFLYQDYRIYQCRRYLPVVDVMITVCEGIAEEYHKNFSVKPIVITNAADFKELIVSPLIPGKIRMIHHGGINSSRKIEKMIEMMDFVDTRFSLDLMLVPAGGSPGYFSYLKKMAASRTNIRIRNPVEMQEITSTINLYDIGIYILEPNNFNNCHTLPNKFFEFVQGRLAIAIGPSPEMEKIVKKYDIGIIADDFSPQSLAKKLNDLTSEQIAYFKMQSHKSARTLSSENNMIKLEQMVKNLGAKN